MRGVLDGRVRGVAPLHPRPLFGSIRFPFAFEHGFARVISAQTVYICQHLSRPVLHLTVSSAPHPQTSDLCVPHASFDMGVHCMRGPWTASSTVARPSHQPHHERLSDWLSVRLRAMWDDMGGPWGRCRHGPLARYATCVHKQGTASCDDRGMAKACSISRVQLSLANTNVSIMFHAPKIFTPLYSTFIHLYIIYILYIVMYNIRIHLYTMI